MAISKDAALALQLGQYNPNIEKIRSEDYPLLQSQSQVYLDHAGTTLYAKSLVDAVHDDRLAHIYGNPHSDHRPSKHTSKRVEDVRRQALAFFNADPEHFDLIFVASATAAIKLVGDCFRDAGSETKKKRFWYGYHRDSHTSLVGLRESTKGYHQCFRDDADVAHWIDGQSPTRQEGCKERGKGQLGLFAYPGQSNMTGRRLPLQWPSLIRQSHLGEHTYTLLDAAALATTAPIDLSDPATAPDFMAVSFYKIFGSPNLGALVVRKATGGAILRQRKNFYGGTVDMVISLDNTWHAKKEILHDRLEDGTLPFLTIIELGLAIKTHLRLFTSMSHISRHTASLARCLQENLVNLRHRNGRPVCAIYNDYSASYGDSRTQGSTVVFNILAADGTFVGYTDVERLADKQNISIRSGSLCNPGGFATFLQWSSYEMKAAYDAGHRCSCPTQIVQGKPTGVVRVSMGAMSNLQDVNTFLDFVKQHYIDLATATDLCNLSGSIASIAETVNSSHSSPNTVNSSESGSIKSAEGPKQGLRKLWSEANLRRPNTATSTATGHSMRNKLTKGFSSMMLPRSNLMRKQPSLSTLI